MGKGGDTHRLSEELVAHVESDVAAWLATCNRAGRPEATRVVGSRVGADRRTVVLYVPSDQAGATFDNLRENGRLAVFYVQVTNYRAIQIKGALLGLRSTRDDEAELQERYTLDFATACAKVGIPFEIAATYRHSPSMAVEMTIEEVYAQTPGPRAGELLR